jgi:rubredoxin
MTNPEKAVMSSDRDEFEQWASATPHIRFNLARGENGLYKHVGVRDAWDAWQASRSAPAVKDALPGAEAPRFRKEMDEIEANISKYTVFSLFTLMRQYVNASPPPAVPAGEPAAYRCVICQCVMREDDDSGLCDEHKYDEQPYAWLTPGGDVYRSRKMAMEFCMPPKLPQPLFTRPSGAVPVELEQIIKFLLGEGELDGLQFGEYPSDKAGKFWWRKNLRAALEQFLAGVK